MRLDKHLSQLHPEFSRAHLQKLIKDGKILINNKKTSPHYQIKSDDKIVEIITPPAEIDLSPDPLIKLEIVCEDENYLVINKPAGLVVHPSESVKSHTLVNAILSHCPQVKNIRDPLVTNDQLLATNLRPGIVHRLDRDVSGLMVIAKTQAAFDDLKRQFQNRKIKKKYTALVYGNVVKDQGEINLSIGRSKDGHKMSARHQPKLNDKTAITKYRVVKRFKVFTLLKIQTLTGRTHQIRVHLRAIGCPIVGDQTYKTNKTKKRKNKIEIARIFLYADYLEFHDLKNQTKTFKLDLPDELENILKNLKSNEL